ncbi:TPA: hypothetical protein HA265_00230 [Candidatus Woesearchaeota archaeon]|nr:hypothetical protein [Candidatus Woesearchaeota archaeon]
MATQALEQMLGNAPATNESLDAYTTGLSRMYSGPMGPGGFGPGPMPGPLAQPGVIRPSYGQTVIPYGDILRNGGEFHDTFKIDRYGNPYGGHTTFNLPGYKKQRMDW